MPDFKLRPATAADAAFAFKVEENAMRGYAEQTWGRWLLGEDPQAAMSAFEPHRHRIIEAGKTAVGIMAVDCFDDHIYIAKLYLLEDYRNAGLGLLALNSVLAEAKLRALPVRLRVLPVNVRAQAFYARHGFLIESERDERIYMVHLSGA